MESAGESSKTHMTSKAPQRIPHPDPKAMGTISKTASVFSSLSKFSTISRSESIEQEMKRLQAQNANYAMANKANERKLERMEEEIERRKSQIVSYRQRMGGALALKENDFAIRKTISILENRLQDMNTKLLNVEDEINKTKKCVDENRKEIMMEDKVSERLTKDLRNGEIERRELEKEICSKKRQQTEIKQILIKHKMKTEGERMTYEKKYFELESEIKNNRGLKDRTSKTNPSRKGRNGEQTTRLSWGDVDSAHKENKITLKKGIRQSLWKLAMNKVAHDKFNKPLNSYKDAFSIIEKQAKINSLEEMVRRFHEVEREVYTKFSYIRELQDQRESLEEDIVTETKMAENMRHQKETEDNARKSILKELFEQRNAMLAKKESLKVAAKQLKEEEHMLEEGIEKIYKTLVPDSHSETEKIPKNKNSYTTMSYLGIIEEKIQDVISELKKTANNSSPLSPIGFGGGARSFIGTDTELLQELAKTGPSIPKSETVVCQIKAPKCSDVEKMTQRATETGKVDPDVLYPYNSLKPLSTKVLKSQVEIVTAFAER